MSTIWKLHQEQAPGPQPEREPVKSAHCADSQPDDSMLLAQERSLSAVPRRFARSRGGPLAGSYKLDQSAIMSILNAATPPDQSGRFEMLAARDRVQSWLARRAQRGRAGDDPPGPLAIQM